MTQHSIKIVGPAGQGIKVTGQIIAKTLKRSGFNVFAYTEYPSLIRGGHNTYQIDFSDKEINSSKDKTGILIGLTKDAITKEISDKKLETNAIIICDESEDINASGYTLIKAPLVAFAKKISSEIMKNTVGLGVAMGIMDLDITKINNVLEDIFSGKGDAAANNIEAAKMGFTWVQDNSDIGKIIVTKKEKDDRVLVSGNQACAMAIIASGCQIYVAYPMTPASEILHFLEAKQKQSGVLIHQPEDEIAGIHVAIGASLAGARAATGTSGGGFALMNEGLSLVGMTETPLVIFEVMRPAPATGNPTWSDQGDLQYVINSGHGEFPKAVIAPGLPEQCFDLTQHAFNLAESYQTSVIVLTDKHLGESLFTVDKDVFDEIDKQTSTVVGKKISTSDDLFKRYKITADGVSPRTIPGTQHGEYIANSDEHDERGYSDESASTRIAQMDKRMKKLETLRKEIPLPKVYGPKKAKATLICWGSTLGAVLDTVKDKKDVNVVHFSYVWPFPKGIEKFLRQFKKLILVENNKTGQLGKLIRQETGINIEKKILKYDSRPFWTGEILDKLK